MALKPCKVCGTFNAEGVDTCLSCDRDPEKSKRPAIFRYIAIAETIYLNGIPGMVDAIHAAAAEPLSEGTPLEEFEW